MNDRKFKRYITETIELLKKQAFQAKNADHPKDGFSEDYSKGFKQFD